MLEKLDTIRMARAMNSHAAERAKLVAGNVANADTPGYRARDLSPFADTYRSGAASPMRATRPGHLSDAAPSRSDARVIEDQGGLSPNGNSVSLEAEMVKTAEAKRQHEISVAIYRSSLSVLRSAIGRRG